MAKHNTTSAKAVMRILNGKLKVDEHALTKIFLKQLDNIYCIKKHLLTVLPNLSAKASFADLKGAIIANIDTIKMQVLRMEVIYKMFKAKYNPDNCIGVRNFSLHALENLVLSSEEPLENDLALLVHLQLAESVEIAYFEVLQNISVGLNNTEVETLLSQNADTATSTKKLYELIANEYLI